jgi:hypothetical protein
MLRIVNAVEIVFELRRDIHLDDIQIEAHYSLSGRDFCRCVLRLARSAEQRQAMSRPCRAAQVKQSIARH